MKSWLVIVLVVLSAHSVRATGQIADQLIVDGDTLWLFSNPLEDYFDLVGNRNLPGFRGMMSTACWRGYMATWELENDSLFLNRITACHDDDEGNQDADLVAMFGSPKPFAYWVNGILRVPRGEMLDYIHMGYGSIFEADEFIKVKEGEIKRRWVKVNRWEARLSQRADHNREMEILAYDTLFHTLETQVDWARQEEQLLFCGEDYFFHFSRKGRIRRVKIQPWLDTQFANWWYEVGQRRCRREIKRSLRDLDLGYCNPKARFRIAMDVLYMTDEDSLFYDKPAWKWELEWREEWEAEKDKK